MGSLFSEIKKELDILDTVLNILMLGISLIDYDFPIDSLFYIVSFKFKLNTDFSYIDFLKK